MINVSIGMLGVALKDGQEAPETPTIKHGLTGGGLVSPERSIDNKAVACGLRANAANGAYVSEVNMGVDFETLAYADSFALYALAAMGNVVSTPVEGKSGYYKHVITLGSVLPELTFWGQIGDTSEQTVHKVDGCKVDTLGLTFEGNAPLDVSLTAAGIDATLFQSWADVVSPSCFDGYFVPTDGTFKLDTASQTPVDVVVTQGNFELSNNLEPKRAAGQVVPRLLAEGKLNTTVAMTVVPEDFDLMRKNLTGSATGTKVSSKIVYGSAAWHFTHTNDENCTLDVEFKNVPWNFEMPDVDPEGNAAEIEFSADDIGIDSADGTPVTITVVNKVESYITE